MADKAEKTNPCGICRAMGASGCKGHGGDEDNDSENEDTLDNQSQSKQFLEIAPIIGKEWQLMDNGLCTFEGFSQSAALSSVQLNHKDCELILTPKDGLAPELEQDKDTLFDQIKTQVEKMGGDIINNDKGQLEISMTNSQEKFSGLVSQLMETNLIPVNVTNLNDKKEAQSLEQESPQAQVSSVISWPPAPPGFSASSSEE